MTELSKIARVTTRGSGLDGVNDGSVKSNALLVHAAIIDEIRRLNPAAVTEVYRDDADGSKVKGYVWMGAMKSVVDRLWGRQAAVKDPVTRQTMGVEINRYLRWTNNAVCLERHGTDTLPKWWIRAAWNDKAPLSSSGLAGITASYTERRLTPHEAGEDRPASEVIVSFREPVITPAIPTATPTGPVPAPPKRNPTSVATAIEAITSAPRREIPVEAPTQEVAQEEEVEVPQAPAATGNQYRLIRNRESFAVTDNGEPAPPDYPIACGVNDINGDRCHRVFRTLNTSNLHRHAGHTTMNALIAAAADMIEVGEQLTISSVAARVGHHPTSVYSHFATLNDLYYAGRKQVEKRRQKAKGTSTATVAAQVRARDVVQLVVGFCSIINAPTNPSAMSTFPLPIGSTRRRAFIDAMIDEGVIEIRQVMIDTGFNVPTLHPGRAFSTDIAKRLSVFNADSGEVTVDATTPEQSEKLDILAVLALASAEITSLREQEPILKEQDEAMKSAAANEAAALALAEEATNEAIALRKQKEAAERDKATLASALEVAVTALTKVKGN